MTREESKAFYPILQAYAEGKVIECRTKPSAVDGTDVPNDWTEMKEIEYWNNTEYRIKPEPAFFYQPVKGSPGNLDITASLSFTDRLILVGNLMQEIQHHFVLKLIGKASPRLNPFMKFHQERVYHLEFFANLSHKLALFIVIPEGKDDGTYSQQEKKTDIASSQCH